MHRLQEFQPSPSRLWLQDETRNKTREKDSHKYTPQQNGVAKRKNRTIMNMVRYMLKAKQITREFLAEAVATVVYILNRCPTKSVCDKTFKEAWHGRRPSIRHLRVFGCIAYAYVLDQLKKKINDKETKKVIISRYVMFDEKGIRDWSSKSQKGEIKSQVMRIREKLWMMRFMLLRRTKLDKKAIGVKLLYKKNYNPNGKIDHYRAKLVVKGYKQKPGINYFEVFALDTIHMIISLLAQNNWKIYQMDIKSSFLNGILEEVYVEKPAGYIVKGKEDKVYRLKKVLYGLKQALRTWYKKIDSYFVQHDFEICSFEYTLYQRGYDMLF
ncbi:hypothetical protein CR513_02911, partial [Mucuna pruriens]